MLFFDVKKAFIYEVIAIRVRLFARNAGQIPGRQPRRVPADGHRPRQRDHRTPHFQGHHRVLRRKGSVRLQRYQGFPGAPLRQQGEDRRRDRDLPAARTQPRTAAVGRAGGPGAQDPHRQQTLFRRRRPAGGRGDRQHHLARPHAALPVRRLLRGVQADALRAGRNAPAEMGAREGRTRGRRTLPDDLRRERRRRGGPDSRHALLEAPDEAHGDQGRRSGVS